MPKITGDSRNQILDAAFRLFSMSGFAGTSMRDIADAVDIKAASLYNHFESKQKLFEELIERETEYVEDQLRTSGAMASPTDDPKAYSEQESERITELVWRSYAPFFEDSRVKMLIHLLGANRYSDERCRNLYQAVFIDRPSAIQQTIFNDLIAKGMFSPCDTSLAAAQFHGPMLMLMETETEPLAARSFCIAHTKAFNAAHRKDS